MPDFAASDATRSTAFGRTGNAYDVAVLAGEDPLDPATIGSQSANGPYTRYLKPGALKGKRFAVPAFILDGETSVFQGCAPTPHLNSLRRRGLRSKPGRRKLTGMTFQFARSYDRASVAQRR